MSNGLDPDQDRCSFKKIIYDPYIYIKFPNRIVFIAAHIYHGHALAGQ